MSKTKTIQAPQPYARERGSPVPANVNKLAGGSSASTIGIDLSQAVSPDRSYPAELAGAVYEHGTVNLLFGQATRSGKIRSLIEISMSPLAVIQSLNVIDTIRNPSLDELLELTGEEKRTLTIFDEDPPEVARLKANMLSIGFSATEASIDFFDASPFTMRNIRNGATSANVVGIVRVDTQTALVYALILKMRELASQFTPQIRQLNGGKK